MKKAPKKKPAVKKRNPSDLTLRNLRAMDRKLRDDRTASMIWRHNFDARLNAIADVVTHLITLLGAKETE